MYNNSLILTESSEMQRVSPNIRETLSSLVSDLEGTDRTKKSENYIDKSERSTQENADTYRSNINQDEIL